MSTGLDHACGITTAGETYCWGYNANGQLGDGTTADSPVPVRVSGGVVFESVAAGSRGTCGLTASGVAYCWGYNGNGNVGDSTFTNTTAPVAVSGGLTFTSLSAGAGHRCAVAATDEAYCWGLNRDGQLGNGRFFSDKNTPTLVSGGLAFQSVSAGADHSCGVTTTARAYCWGFNSEGSLGNGTFFPDLNEPSEVSGGLDFEFVTAGAIYSCGVTTTGEAYCWGDNSTGSLGDGSILSSNVPVLVGG